MWNTGEMKSNSSYSNDPNSNDKIVSHKICKLALDIRMATPKMVEQLLKWNARVYKKQQQQNLYMTPTISIYLWVNHNYTSGEERPKRETIPWWNIWLRNTGTE